MGDVLAAWYFRKEFLLLAAEDAQSSGRSCYSAFGAAGTDFSNRGYASNPVPWGRTETQARAHEQGLCQRPERARFGQSSEKNTYVLQEQLGLFNETEPTEETFTVNAYQRSKKRSQGKTAPESSS